LLGSITGGDVLTGLLPAVKAVMPGRRQPVGQNRESLPAWLTDSSPHPDAFLVVIVALASTPSMADDRVVVANWTTPRQAVQRNHPGWMLSSASGSAIKRITAGVKAAADRPCQVSI
jgi:anti-sigma factor RsiW